MSGARERVASSSDKVSILGFLTHEHSLLALFVTSSDAPGATGGAGASGGCLATCCLALQELTRRQRRWFFVFLLSSTIVASVEVTLGLESGLWADLKSVLVVLPLAIVVKSNIQRLDSFGKLGGARACRWGDRSHAVMPGGVGHRC
jgi:hypothetical protein